MRVKKLSEVLDLDLAWRRVKQDQYNDFVPDILKLMDVDHAKATVIKDVKEALDKGYTPSEILRIDAPKKGYTLRPCGYMVPEDRIVYQAIVDSISRRVEEPPEDCVFSHRLNENLKSANMFRFWRDLWLGWRSKMREVYSSGYCCLLRTDITAYYEQIDYSILRNQILDGQVRDKRILDVLDTLLRRWAISDVKHIGIPQGYDASSFLGNLYLINFDKILRRQGLKYFRYSDEIFIFTRDGAEARRAIKLVSDQLRLLHLNLQEAKTVIIEEPKRIAREIGSDEEDKKKDFDYEFMRKVQTGEVEETEEEVVRRYKEVTVNGRAREVDVSDFVWCLNKLRRLRNDRAVKFILKRFAEMPFLANLFFEYLQMFLRRGSVKEGIIDFLDSKNNVYEWQEMWLLLTLSKAKRLSGRQLAVVRQIISDKRRSSVSRAAGMLALGKCGDDGDRRWLASLYSGEDNSYVKRAVAVSCHGMPKPARNEFYSGVEKDSPAMKRLVAYLRSEQIETI